MRPGRAAGVRGPGKWALPGLVLSLMAALPAAGADTLPPGFTYLEDIAPSVAQDIRYAGADNFTGRRLKGYLAPRCILTRAAAAALKRAADKLQARGLGLKVLDCTRPARAVRDIIAWAKDKRPAPTRAYYFPAYTKPGLFRAGFIARRSSHSRGSAVDITLVRLPAPAPAAAIGRATERDGLRCDAPTPAGRRARPGELDMGTDFDCFSKLSATASQRVGAAARANRQLLLRVMRGAGFVNFSGEWWHYKLKLEPFPARSFDFPIR